MDASNDSQEQRWECEFCNKTYAYKFYLQIHVRTHTGEKPYKCGLCSKAFTQNGSLSCHMKTHTGEKPYECDLCQKTFAHKSNLERHRKAHGGGKPFVCSLCDKAFTNGHNLKYHLRTHSGERPYKCSLCQKVFAHNAILKKHMKIHTREKPHKSTAFNCDNHVNEYEKTCIAEKPDKLQSVGSAVEDMRLGSNCDPRCDVAAVSDSFVDRIVLSTMEYLRNLSYRQSLLPLPTEEQHSIDPLMITADVNDLNLRPYGCGLCDQMFAIEKEFIDHCYRHYCDAPQQDTFLELFEMHLGNYFL